MFFWALIYGHLRLPMQTTKKISMSKQYNTIQYK